MPQKFKTLHNSLLTNHLLNRRGIATSDLFPRCNTCSENINHLFRECNKAKELCNCIPFGCLMRGNMDNPYKEWIPQNLRRNRVVGNESKIPWHMVFVTALWQIWKDRNKKSFENIDVLPRIIAKTVMTYSEEIVEASKAPSFSGPSNVHLNLWTKPLASNT